MGQRGPVPNRTDQRRRRNTPETPVTKASSGASDLWIPKADENWHPIAADWFNSLRDSGQARFYEPSDWQVAKYLAEAMSRNLHQGKFSAQLFASVMSGMSELLTTEGARRRVKIELERAPADADEDAAVAALDDYRARLSG